MDARVCYQLKHKIICYLLSRYTCPHAKWNLGSVNAGRGAQLADQKAPLASLTEVILIHGAFS